ncbi:MAG: FecR domain-containing protein [Ginsengibacter sp.]
MEEPVSRFEYLFGRCIANDFTTEERDEFLSLAGKDEYKVSLNALIEEAFENAVADREIKPQRADQLFENILRATEPEEGLPAVRVIKGNYFRWVAAASVITLLAAGGHFLFFKSNQAQIISGINSPRKEKIVIAPAGNKALLTLDNGATIVLDSAVNGTLTKQGNAKVIKLNNGTLAYQPAGFADGKISYNTITTPRGGQYQVLLPDGTMAWLNAASSLKFPTAFTGQERKVILTGEVYFEVKHESDRPFVVVTGETSVEVLGTHFNVNSYEDEPDLKVTLLEGAVKVNRGTATAILKPGQQAVLKTGAHDQKSNPGIFLSSNIDTDEVIAWKNGEFQFGEKSDIQAIMRQISRWYNVEVEYNGDVSGQYWGSISRNADISQVLKLLEKTGAMNFKIEGNKIIISP